jgi:dienelactone hydrolase
MRKILLIAFAGLLMAVVASMASASENADSPSGIAARLLDHLDNGDFASAEAMFTTEMAAAVPADKLRAVWTSLPAQAGEATGRGDATTQTHDDRSVVQVPLHYADAELVATVAIDADGKVAGFLVKPAAPPAAAPPPADAAYEERDATIGTGERALPGTLALPRNAPPTAGFPGVVLVHGSGPHDRDESIGPNRPFLDLARGLAARGIAVLRFDKRTKARPQDYAVGDLTIDRETTDDAVAALATLATTPGVDARRLFVLGHSQGGMLAPRIATHAAEAGTTVAGLVLLAAPARPLLDLLLEQNRRLAVLDDARTSAAERAALDTLQAQVRAIRAGPQGTTMESTPLGLSADYWRSTDAVDPVAEAEAVALPMLVLQGARDIQVVDADWQRWKAAFHDDAQVVFKLYPALNHLGIAGDGPGSLAEYAVPGHVDAQLIDDVAGWVRQH